ncbi:MAG: late competence development ComFB family protein [Candidatus Omnitrophica bacterium]|nr:late competence development ComFB family protein [Candidatus Omnitrophota bacterium]
MAMKIHNYMEDMAADKLEEILSEKDDICKCQKCRFDMIVWALNHLPPKYVVTEKGRMYTKLIEQDVQFRVDIVKELTKAVLRVSRNPSH